jgi:hypothetical protein
MRGVDMSIQRRGLGVRLSGAIVGVALLAACEVTNPGPVEDEVLGDGATQQGMVNGSIRKLAEAVNGGNGGLALIGAVVSRELFPGGNTNYNLNPVLQGGHAIPGGYGAMFEQAQQARYVAEESIRRFTEKSAAPDLLYQANLYAGFAYRVLGEHWCQAVIDGSALLPGRTYFEKGQAAFTEAIRLANTDAKRQAAYAGRAQLRLWLSDWAGAAADAQQVPASFRLDLGFDAVDFNTQNIIQQSNANLPYRSYSIHFTFQKDYYTQTGDPRAEWVVNPAIPFANSSLQGYGQVPWSNQVKYRAAGDAVRLAGGPEMLLVRAEAILAQTSTQWAQALELINQVHTSYVSKTTNRALAPVTATSAEETWARLKRERSLELWLEARHWGDQRRWADQKTPGAFALPNWEALSPLFSANPRSLCLDVPDSERLANPNVPEIS